MSKNKPVAPNVTSNNNALVVRSRQMGKTEATEAAVMLPAATATATTFPVPTTVLFEGKVGAEPSDPAGDAVFAGPESTHAFVQFVAVIAVEDSRGQEELTDRARVGLPLGPHGVPVTGIALRDGWFLIATEGRSYEVPVSNIRSARR